MPSTPPSNGTSTVKTFPTAADLLTRCQTLLAELETFKEYLKSNNQDHRIEIAHFRNTVKSEVRTLTRLVDHQDHDQSQNDNNEGNADTTQHTVNSSNLPFLETVWATVKNNTGLQAMQKRFYWTEKGQKRGQKKQNSALVDVVAGDGLQWFKVSLLTNNRLLFDKAKQGWEDASSSDDDDQDDNKSEQDDSDTDIPLVKMTKDLVRAAKDVRIRTNHPNITLVLPKIHTGEIPAIDKILDQLRSLGVSLLTSSSTYPPTPFAQVMPHLLTNPFTSFSPTLNIDCTILLALVSDFSHCQVEAEPWFHRALKRQVEIEDEENLLPNLLYPALANRNLSCTAEAATRMREIVDTIGTQGEKQRTKLFMGDDSLVPTDSLHERLGGLSRFPVPGSLRLPVVVVADTAESGDASTLPRSAQKVKEQLTAINQSVFLHGWARGITTITSNRTVVKQIEAILNKEAQDENEWPLIWLCPTARSLVGKEKGRRD